MRISALADRTCVPVATLKYYLRDGVLHPGRSLSRTQADYDESHVDRVRLVRALTEVGGLSIAATRRILDALDATDVTREDVLAASQRALVQERPASTPPASGSSSGGGDATDGGAAYPPVSPRARGWLERLGWEIDPADPLIEELDRAWAACAAADIGLDEQRLSRYAECVAEVARLDVDSVPDDPAGALRQAVLGTVLLDPVLITLRRLAHQHLTVSAAAASPRGSSHQDGQ